MKQRWGRAELMLLFSLAGCSTTPMGRAIDRGSASEVTALLDQGYDLNARIGGAEMTPLKLAVDRHRPQIVELLLERGADINIRHKGTSALSLAAIRGDREMSRLLLSKGAEVTARDIKWAAGPDRVEIAAMLEAAAQKRQAAPAAAESRSEDSPGVSTTTFSDMDAPSYKMGERPDDFALVVGIEHYLDGPDARFATRDAAALRAHLTALGWQSRNILLLSDEAAGRSGLDKYLGRWLPNNVGENSRVFFYFAGAGAVDAAGHAYLLPWDGDAALLEATGYPLSRLYAKLNALKVKSVVAVLDAGFSGMGARTHAAPKADKPAKKVDLAPGDVGDVVVIAAASGAESLELSESERHGRLTDLLLKGLNGAAADALGVVTVRGLFSFAHSETQRAVKHDGRPRAPKLLTGNLGEADLRLR